MLTGRHLTVELFPFDLEEMRRSDPNATLDNYLSDGGFSEPLAGLRVAVGIATDTAGSSLEACEAAYLLFACPYFHVLGATARPPESQVLPDRQRAATGSGDKGRRRLERKQGAARELSLELVHALASPGPALVAELVSRRGAVLLPWELDRERSVSQLTAAPAEFHEAISQGEALEFADRDYVAATRSYRRAWEVAEGAAAQALARLGIARSMIAAGRAAEAAAHVDELLRTPLTVTDEYGMPFAVFAISQAEQLPESVAPDLGAHLEEHLSATPWLAAATLRTILGYVEEGPTPAGAPGDAAGAPSTSVAEALVARSERLEALRDELPALRAGAGLMGATVLDPQPWIAARGEPLWLVGVRSRGGRSAVAVVSADAALAAAGAVAGLELTTARAEEDVPLGARFPGVYVRFPPDLYADLAAASALRRLLYTGALFVVVSAAAFGAWFVSRDIRREAALIEMRSRFVASVSHELKTPLTAVRMFAETLQRDTLAPDKRTRCIETILAESERLSRLLDNVLDFSKIERGEKHYVLEPVHLQEPVKRAKAALRHQLTRQGFSLETAIDEHVPAVVADADAIEQAVANLVSNAVKYSNGERRIELSLRRQDDEAVISVSDRGIGIREADRGKIFDEFFRADVVDRSQVPGTGLGLTIVAHIAEAHGARIDVDSEPGKGSTFSLCLPLRDGRGAADGGEAARSAEQVHGDRRLQEPTTGEAAP